MLSINTNLSSLITQNSLKNSTSILNQAVERMTTGYKINHAKDNAANYSISTNMTTKIGAYMVAEDNVLQGLDMVNTASENLSLIDDKLNRLRALAVQSTNGTYGEQSLKAINAEANALVDEINRTYATAEYNGIKTFKGTAKLEIPDGVGTTGNVGVQTAATYSMRATNYGDFLADPVTKDQAYVDALTSVKAANGTLSASEYKVASEEDLIELARLVNSGVSTEGKTFYLAKDLDIGAYCDAEIAAGNGGWTPIGNSTNRFYGTFDGNGHVIKNLKIERNADYQGLFGYAESEAEMKNVGLEEGGIRGKTYIGELIGYTYGSITNCYATGNATALAHVGGLAGDVYGSVTNCYATGNIAGTGSSIGGLVGYNGGGNESITNSYATGMVSGSSHVGGLVGDSAADITNSYATGNVTGTGSYVGGLVGYARSSNVNNSYATGAVSGTTLVGGLVGCAFASSTFNNNYATGDVSGANEVGGLVGSADVDYIRSNYATGNVAGTGSCVGGLVGYAEAYEISNSYATGSVSGNGFVGGLIGQVKKTSSTTRVKNCLSYSTVSGSDADSTGSLIGGAVVTADNTTFGTINVTDCQAMSSGMNTVGGSYMYASSTYTLLDTYDMSAMLAGISLYTPEVTSLTLQVGANAPNSNQITFDMAFMLENLEELRQIGQNTTSDSITLCDKLINTVSEKQTLYGAVQNRLMSVLDEITTQRENLASSRSTIRDADIAEVSSHYIQQQILQQASATLMATANQSPSIALQLI